MPWQTRELKNIVSDIVTRNLTPQLKDTGDWLENRALEMRADKPLAERLIWERVWDGRRGYEMVPQVPIDGRYIVDFLIPDVGLVIEIDGSSHQGKDELDWQRTHYLLAKGYDVRRFANSEVYSDVEGVLTRIDKAVFELVMAGREIKPAASPVG